MRNSIRNVSDLAGGIKPTIDIEDVNSDLVVFERADMTIVYTSRIANRYKFNETYWLVKTLGYNAADEVVYMETERVDKDVPDFVEELDIV